MVIIQIHGSYLDCSCWQVVIIPIYESTGKGMLPHMSNNIFRFLPFRQWIRVI
jgi:hypothetical protein